MHVLITADSVGGVWTYARELVTGLCRAGVTVTLVSFGEIPMGKQTTWMDSLHGLDFRPTGFKLEWMQDSAEDLAASAEYLETLIEEAKPDLLHFNQYYYGAIKSNLPRVVVAHSDVVSWWQAVHGKEPPNSDWLRDYRRLVSRGLSEATAVLAPSQWMLDQIAANYIEPIRGSVIHNGRSPSLFISHLSKRGYALSVGRVWDPGKQVVLLSHAESPLPVYVVGPDRNPDSQVCESGVPGPKRENIEYMGLQSEDELRELFARANTYIATSRYEPFGLAPLEAALSRCSLVLNDIPTFRELWGPDALYFAANDSRSLSAMLRRVCADSDLRREYANRAFHRARQNFTSARMVKEYLEFYGTLVRTGVRVA